MAFLGHVCPWLCLSMEFWTMRCGFFQRPMLITQRDWWLTQALQQDEGWGHAAAGGNRRENSYL